MEMVLDILMVILLMFILLMDMLMMHTEFGETDSTTGIWKPKTSPSVTYGTNGFFLDFAIALIWVMIYLVTIMIYC